MNRVASCGVLLLAVAFGARATSQTQTVYVPLADARPVLEALVEILPAELRNAAPNLEPVWPRWAAEHDREIRARLDRGDDDTVVNWLLFGTSFTKLPRVDLDKPPEGGRNGDAAAGLASLIGRRATDLVASLARLGRDERAAFARRVLARAGQRLDTPTGREAARAYLLAAVARVAREQQAMGNELAGARQRGDLTEELATRSRLFRSRGLSLDTSLAPNLAIERSLAAMTSQGLIQRGGIRRVLVIGPGLDFADKLAGFDFYPEQTLQPFALIDTLVRLGLASAATVELTTIDVSPRVNEHLKGAVANAAREIPYIIQLPLDDTRPWRPDMRAYWKGFGAAVGADVRPIVIPSDLQGVALRAVSIPPAVAKRIRPRDLNIVVQRLTGEAFDLAVATNVFVYYDLLDQSLALRNVAAMLRPGGFLLSNNALLELPGSPLMSVGYFTTQYSDRPDDGDHVVWYQAR